MPRVTVISTSSISAEALASALGVDPSLSVDAVTADEDLPVGAGSDVVVFDNMSLAAAKAFVRSRPGVAAVALGVPPDEAGDWSDLSTVIRVPDGTSTAEARAIVHALAGARDPITARTALDAAAQPGRRFLLDCADLTTREREVFHLVHEGLSNKEIARRLWLAESTVKKHVHSLFKKLHVSSRRELGALAERHLAQQAQRSFTGAGPTAASAAESPGTEDGGADGPAVSETAGRRHARPETGGTQARALTLVTGAILTLLTLTTALVALRDPDPEAVSGARYKDVAPTAGSGALSQFSTVGVPAKFAAGAPTVGGMLLRPQVLSDRHRDVLFRAGRTNAGPCYGVGRRSGGGIRVLELMCPSPEERFPSPERPVLETIVVDVSGARGARVSAVEGFAADGVQEVALVSQARGVLARARVSSNVFSLKSSSVSAVGATLVARNRDGVTVWQRHLHRGTLVD